MAEEAEQGIRVIINTTPNRVFGDHEEPVLAVAVFPDMRRMITGSGDKTLRLWDLKDGVVLKIMEGHCDWVGAVAISRDGRLIASGDEKGMLIIWDGDTGEPLTQSFQAHSAHSGIDSLDFSPDGAALATGGWDKKTKLWITKTWRLQGKPLNCRDYVNCVRYSPSGEHLAIATLGDIQIWDTNTRECIKIFEGHAAHTSLSRTSIRPFNKSLAWTPDGKRLLSAGTNADATIREWDTTSWEQVQGSPWKGHDKQICAIAVNSAATLVASASYDNDVRLWQLSNGQTIAIFRHSDWMRCVTFSLDGEHILSGGGNKKISEWTVPEDVLPPSKNIAISTTARKACISGDLLLAEELLTQEIDSDPNNHIPYASRSFVMARKHNWDHALRDALMSIRIQPSLTGYTSKGIALCGKKHFKDAMRAFDLASMFTDGDLKTIHRLLLIKAIATFNANHYEDAILRVQELAASCPDADNLACGIVEAYLHVQLGINASNGTRHDEAADHFAAAVNGGTCWSKSVLRSQYVDFVVLFGWDLKSLWRTANEHLCHALLHAGRLPEAVESYRHMMDMSDDTTKASCLRWSTAFKQKCSTLYATNGDVALAASDYDMAILLYSKAIELDHANEIIFANCTKAKLKKALWEEALVDAQKVIELDPSSHIGYQLKHEAFRGARRYDEAIEAFQIMLSKLDNSPETQIRKLRQQYLTPPEADGAIRKSIQVQMENAPLRLLNTSTGHLCDRDAQIVSFKSSTNYKELLLSTMKHEDFRMERIKKSIAMYFRYVMLSHRWEEKEPLLYDIQEKVVYRLNPVGGVVKLQSFCKFARKAGYRWAWVDTCCIDQNNNVELQKSLNSMFAWYRRSALTIVYLSDVPPLSKSGTLAKSAWNTRGWTVPEFLAPKVVLFYQSDWTMYLDDRSPNHKESAAIMQELGDATGIDPRALVAFRPGMRGAREKLRWASTRVTTLQEDIAYSLFGIFGIHLPIIYGEMKENALGRLLQEVVGRSGDITALDWVGTSSEFNSCLPANITSYEAPPCMLPSLSEDDIQTSVATLRSVGVVELALRLYTTLDNLSAPRFSHRRLHLPCIAFPITEVRRRHSQDQEIPIYEVKTDGLGDLLITTEDRLIPFLPTRPLAPWQTFLLARPWNRDLLELPNPSDDMQSMENLAAPSSPLLDTSLGENKLVDTNPHSRALRLIVRLGQPFSAFLLARQHSGEYKRIASNRDIVAQVKDMTSVRDMMDIRTLEIS
ncbi:uncharacterized protein EDB93DRAFT_358436 [Suillus bovinus]|uniref:uncharacterized protein n=1 Tax=Suillus bovinus TaxID=48563 RepID=UPI001B885210|nr:uncharacterized protein EDB93DRAFT_358436 [Suillus bovinus]KAG2149068.1 hypothetical protein EDB93DRAFT_358436 [Suillus bovinus]